MEVSTASLALTLDGGSNPLFDQYLDATRGEIDWDGFGHFGWSIEHTINLFQHRERLNKSHSYAIPTSEYARAITRISPRLIEIGAGTGYWKWYLSQFGIDVVAYDTEPYENHYVSGQWAEVLKGSYEKIEEHPDRALMMVWPPYSDELAFQALTRYTGDYLFYVGEEDGCTADDQFRYKIYEDWDLHATFQQPNWCGIHSYQFIYRRRTHEKTPDPVQQGVPET